MKNIKLTMLLIGMIWSSFTFAQNKKVIKEVSKVFSTSMCSCFEPINDSIDSSVIDYFLTVLIDEEAKMHDFGIAPEDSVQAFDQFKIFRKSMNRIMNGCMSENMSGITQKYPELDEMDKSEIGIMFEETAKRMKKIKNCETATILVNIMFAATSDGKLR